MMEILFKGQRVDTKEWVYGWYFESFTGIAYIIVMHDHILGVTEFYEVIKETVGQFTGLLDKNGERVFEGDIISARTLQKWDNCKASYHNQYGVIVYNPEKTRFESSVSFGERQKDLYNTITKLGAEVIGNIHQNKELLV